MDHEYGLMPFWFWNDRLDDAELLRQLDDFERHGVGGFVIHPRIGLPEDLGWMSDALLDHYEVVIAEAERRGLKVLLYDEGMYPSGSSAGQVVAENPAFACRCLATIVAPEEGEPDLPPGQHLVSLYRRSSGERMAIIDRPADSHIRGLHYLGEGPEEQTHPAADILNPDAVATFVRLVYQRFADRFARYFGSTIIGIFTDEPGALGRPNERGIMPGTTGILTEVSRILGYDITPHLPALFEDDVPDADARRADYRRAIAIRLEETFYSQLASWCETHGLPLAGHPGEADDIGCLRYFHIPGQDTVWRWVLPDDASALEGAESTQAKCSSSAALHGGRRRNLNECCGAYGHELTWDEMHWLADWCLVRGVNLLVPHAFYYSLRGPRRDERPPDVGPNSPWWDRYPDYAAHCRFCCWLNTDSDHQCEVAILGQAAHLPWRAAKVCFQHQFDFNYLEERDCLDRAHIDSDGIHIAGMCYRVLIIEHQPSAAVQEALAPMRAAGGVIEVDTTTTQESLVQRLTALLAPSICIDPPTPALRVRRLRKQGQEWCLLFNEEGAEQVVRIDDAGWREVDTRHSGEQPTIRPPTRDDAAFRFAGHELKVLVRSVAESDATTPHPS